MGSLNPDTWNDITGNDTLGGRIFNTVFGLNPDGKTQAYLDENAFAYLAMYLQNIGAFNTSAELNVNTLPDDIKVDVPNDLSLYSGIFQRYIDDYNFTNVTINKGAIFYNTDNPYEYNNSSSEIWWYSNIERVDSGGFSYNGKSVDFSLSQSRTHKISKVPCNYGKNYRSPEFYAVRHIAWAIAYGDYIINDEITGISTQDNAKIPDLSGVNTVDEALAKLKEQYPELFENAINQDVVQPDGSTITYTYVPVSMPELDPNGNPISSTSTQATPDVDPDTAPDSLLDTITGSIETDPPINPPDTGKGNTPEVVTPTGSASALYAIYNPTLEQINSFGAWLWSSDFIDQIKKLFNDPMQAIIGLHKVYATPSTNGTQNIKVGYLDSGVPSNVVSNQYTTIDCGTVSLSEYFYNVFDYAPYTDINLYLPFIGIVGLDVADVMRSSINIIYHVDVLSGACLAEVKVIRDRAGGTLYQYTGNASVTLPISSGSYMGIISSIAGIAGGIAGTIASGGSALPLLASSAGSLLNARTKVEHSGGFSGNAGAMGSKIPYLIISRPQVDLANKFERYIGYPANITTNLASCSGFVNVLECHLENINATDSELNEIESLLKGGIIV